MVISDFWQGGEETYALGGANHNSEKMLSNSSN